MPSSYDFTSGREAPLISRDSVFEISARTLSDGSVLSPVDLKEVTEIAKNISNGQYDSVAVVLLNSYLNGKLETDVKNFLQDLLPQCQVISSAEIWPEMKEYQRALVTCLNAYIHPLIDEYFDLKQKITQQKIKLDQISNKFKEIKSLAIEYKKDKDNEINKLNEELEKFKKTIEKNNTLYESMLDKTTQSLEKIISNTESMSKIQ